MEKDHYSCVCVCIHTYIFVNHPWMQGVFEVTIKSRSMHTYKYIARDKKLLKGAVPIFSNT